MVLSRGQGPGPPPPVLSPPLAVDPVLSPPPAVAPPSTHGLLADAAATAVAPPPAAGLASLPTARDLGEKLPPGAGDFVPVQSALPPAGHAAAGSSFATQQRTGSFSFAQVLCSSMAPQPINVAVHPPAATDMGYPAAFFSLEEIGASCNQFAHSVVAYTPHGRSQFLDIRTHLQQRFNFAGDFAIGALSPRHLLIRFLEHSDYIKMLLKNSLLIKGRLFKFSRWSIEFSPHSDSPIVPVWLELPLLPINFFLEEMLNSIAGSLGEVLQIDRDTLCLARPSVARVCVLLDVSQPVPEQIWIGIGPRGFWQPIVCPFLPRFCSRCSRLGHTAEACKKAGAARRPAGDEELLPPAPGFRRAPDAVRPPRAAVQAWRPARGGPVGPSDLQGVTVQAQASQAVPAPASSDAPVAPVRELPAEPLHPVNDPAPPLDAAPDYVRASSDALATLVAHDCGLSDVPFSSCNGNAPLVPLAKLGCTNQAATSSSQLVLPYASPFAPALDSAAIAPASPIEPLLPPPMPNLGLQACTDATDPIPASAASIASAPASQGSSPLLAGSSPVQQGSSPACSAGSPVPATSAAPPVLDNLAALSPSELATPNASLSVEATAVQSVAPVSEQCATLESSASLAQEPSLEGVPAPSPLPKGGSTPVEQSSPRCLNTVEPPADSLSAEATIPEFPPSSVSGGCSPVFRSWLLPEFQLVRRSPPLEGKCHCLPPEFSIPAPFDERLLQHISMLPGSSLPLASFVPVNAQYTDGSIELKLMLSIFLPAGSSMEAISRMFKFAVRRVWLLDDQGPQPLSPVFLSGDDLRTPLEYSPSAGSFAPAPALLTRSPDFRFAKDRGKGIVIAPDFAPQTAAEPRVKARGLVLALRASNAPAGDTTAPLSVAPVPTATTAQAASDPPDASAQAASAPGLDSPPGSPVALDDPPYADKGEELWRIATSRRRTRSSRRR